MFNPCLFPSEHSFLLVVGVDQKRATPISKPTESEETPSMLSMPKETANTIFLMAGSEVVEFGYMTHEFHPFRDSNNTNFTSSIRA